MPRSRRDRPVSLTKVKKRGREGRAALIEKVRAAVDAHASLYVLTYKSLRAAPFKEVRARWPLGPPVPGARPDAGVAKGGGGGGGKRAKPAAAASTALGA